MRDPDSPLTTNELDALRYLHRHGPVTAFEAYTDEGHPMSVAPAFTTLRQIGLVYRTGLRRPTCTGALAHVIAIAPAGIDAIYDAL